MSSRYPIFDRARLKIASLEGRIHDLSASVILPLLPVSPVDPSLEKVAESILNAKHDGKSVVLMMGAHVLRSGVQRYLIDLLERGLLSCVAMNGAGVIHDYELALIGATTENVSEYLREGRFGLWKETGEINEIIFSADAEGKGLGEAVGETIENGAFPYRDISVLAAGYRCEVPITIHVGIGYDIIHELPNCDGRSLGSASYRDFLIFAKVLEALDGGVVMNFGSAVMGPEIFLKALSMVRNIATQKGEKINKIISLVCDLVNLPTECNKEPCRNDSRYYFRPWKTLLARSVAEGGDSFYVQGNHRDTIPQLWTALVNS